MKYIIIERLKKQKFKNKVFKICIIFESILKIINNTSLLVFKIKL